MSDKTKSKVPRPWTEEEEASLYSMREDGIPYRVIAVELKRSVRACERKYQITNWTTTPHHDPVKGRVREGVKRAYVERITQLGERRRNTHNLIGDIVGDRIAQAVSALPTAKKVTYKKRSSKKKKHSDEDVGLILSDCHIGHHHTMEETGGISEYNSDIFMDRVENLKGAVQEIYELHTQLYNLPTLHIFSLGDVVAGMNASGAWSPTYINLSIYDQVILGVDAIADMIYYWLGMFDEIHFHGLIGNHGRAAPAGIEKEYVNWDLICYRFLEARFQNNPRVVFDIPLTWWIMKEIRHHNFLLVHGDSIRGSNPLKQLVVLEEKMTGILKRMPDYTLAAHFHNPAELTTNHGRVVINGSFVGSDIFSLKDLKQGSQPEQKVFGIHDKRGITWTYNLNLSIDR